MRTRGAQPWTGSEQDELQRRWDAGENDTVISAAMGRSPHAIGIRRQRKGLVKRRIKSNMRLQDYATQSLRGELRRRGDADPSPALSRAHRRVASLTTQVEEQRQRADVAEAHRKRAEMTLDRASRGRVDRLESSLRQMADQHTIMATELQAARAEIDRLRSLNRIESLTLGELMQALDERGYNVVTGERKRAG